MMNVTEFNTLNCQFYATEINTTGIANHCILIILKIKI
ncbi:hypothetical protein FHS70_000326 [Flammeovirga yaeyamensis]|nr:hypothetical protein [Flammeovirga yaeyamensis]